MPRFVYNGQKEKANGKFSRITDEDVLLVGERYGIGTAPEVLAQVKSAAARL